MINHILNFLVIFFFLLSASAESDPFADVYEGRSAQGVFWEKMLTDDSQYDSKLIFIDGFLKLSKRGTKSFDFYLFVDSESLNYSRPRRCVYIDSIKLDSILTERFGMNYKEKNKLSGKYVKILGVYCKPKNQNELGVITGPLSIYFQEGDSDMPKK
jgi:hypothetical protein